MVAAAIAESASASHAYRAFFAQMLSRVRRSILAVERDAAQIAQLRQEIDGGGAARQCNIETQAVVRAQIARQCSSRANTVKTDTIGK